MKYKTGITIGMATFSFIGLGVGVKANDTQLALKQPLMDCSRTIIQKATTISSALQIKINTVQFTPVDNQNTNSLPQHQQNPACPQNHPNCDGNHIQNHPECDNTRQQSHLGGQYGHHRGHHQ